MRHFLLTALVFSLISPAFAQKIKVRKVKGNTAIIESSSLLRPGAVYDLMSPNDLSEDITPSSRKYLVGLNFALTNTKSDAANATNETNVNLTIKFGWNLGTFELGPLLNYNMSHANDITQTLWKIGGFADYNFMPNISGETFLWGVGGTGAFGNWDKGNGTKVDVMDIFAGPFTKWFPTSSAVGFRVDLGLSYQRQTTTTENNTVSGLASSAGIFAYF
ncbi:MAG: hypothetical protein ACM3MG_13145 [Bacillota bacterium]